MKHEGNSTKLSRKNWINIWVLGFIGQLCWNIENVWFNNFVYDKIAKDPSILAWMGGISAIASTLATLLIGTWSDRKGTRRKFISYGYIIWGVFTIIFGIAEFLPKSPLLLVVSFVVLADAIMSIFGSIGHDAGFQAWTTDISNEKNRGKLGGVLASVPVLATIFGAAVSGIIITQFGYFSFFIIMGVVVSLIGAVSLITVKDAPTLVPKKSQKYYWQQVKEVFSWTTVMQNKQLFWVFIINAIFGSCFQIYFPYITIYFNNYLGYSLDLAGIVLAIALLLAMLLAFPAAKAIDKGHIANTVIVAIACSIIGLLAIAFVPSTLPFLIVATFFVGAGFILMSQSVTAWIKNLYPEHKRGQFEGVRMIFFVCIPMIIGPNIAKLIIEKYGVYMTIDQISGMVPNEMLFISAACLTVLAFLPVIPARRWSKIKHIKGE